MLEDKPEDQESNLAHKYLKGLRDCEENLYACEGTQTMNL